jgi:imidazolonepropionase-like amidohydrolase
MRTNTALALLAALILAGDATAQPANNAPAYGPPVQIGRPAPAGANTNAAPAATNPAAAVSPAAELPANARPSNNMMPLTAPIPIGEPAYLIRGAIVHTMGAQGVIQGADVLIAGGKIAGVGQGIVMPPGAQVIEANGRPVTPGLMASFTQLGILEIDLEQTTNDTTADGKVATAAFDVTDALNPNSTLIPVARIAGVTRAVVAPEPGSSMFLGQAAVIQLGLDPNMVVRPRVGMFVIFDPFRAGDGYDTEQYGSGGGQATAGGGALSGPINRPVLWAHFRETIADAREYLARQAAYHSPGGSRDQRTTRIDLDALAPVLRGEEPIVAFVNRASDIRQLLAYCKQQNLKLIIAGGAEAWMVANELAAAQVPVLVDAYTNLPGNFASLGATLANAARLDKAGVRVAFMPPSDEPSHNARRVTQIAGNAVANGMDYEHALAAITSVPAQIWGIADTYGTLEAGKDADVVLWDGDPLEVTSAPTVVFIKGQKIPMQSRQTKLRDRYRDLNRKDMPLGYH